MAKRLKSVIDMAKSRSLAPADLAEPCAAAVYNLCVAASHLTPIFFHAPSS